MSSGVEDVAEILRFTKRNAANNIQDFRWALLPLWADEVAVNHHPEMPQYDRVWQGIEYGKFELTMENEPATLSVDCEVSVDGDTVVITETETGTLPNGLEFRIPSKLVLGVRDRRIHSLDAYYSLDDLLPLLAQGAPPMGTTET